MRVRSQDDVLTLEAHLKLLRSPDGVHRFVLLLSGPDGRKVPLGPLAAAIGYELIEYTPLERAALTLAGFRLRRADRRQSPLRRLLPLVARQKLDFPEARPTSLPSRPAPDSPATKAPTNEPLAPSMPMAAVPRRKKAGRSGPAGVNRV